MHAIAVIAMAGEGRVDSRARAASTVASGLGMNGPNAVDVVCAACGTAVSGPEFCCRCGARLDQGQASKRQHTRRSFAAAPDEPAWALRLTSTLFPQLPARDLGAFRVALGSGISLIVMLGVAGLFSVGLTAAAVLVPLLTLLYCYDVDIYEDEPLRVVGLTMAWGLFAGIGLGLALGHLELPLQAHGWEQLTDASVATRVFLVPLASLTLALIGPLVLLRFPRFNDVLDGVTFGAASAVTLWCATMLVAAWPLTEVGLRPDQDAGLWTLRLVELGVLVPTIAASSVGWAAGALWLRFRSPGEHRDALGLFGRLTVALATAFALVVLAALAQQVLSPLGCALALAALAAVAVVLVRRAIHLGLLDEIDEIEPGTDITCTNCDRRTPLGNFCGRCGIAFRALPKRPGGRERASK